MKFAGYKRAESEEAAKKSSATLRFWAKEQNHELAFFAWDLTMGKVGLRRVLSAAESGKVQGIVVEEIKDLGRDIVSLVKTLDGLLNKGISVVATESRLSIETPEFVGDSYNAESRIVRALNTAHNAYTTDNRKIGVAAARASGATMGRPRGLTLEDVHQVIENLMNAKAGVLPTTRELAEETCCSVGKSQQLLKQYKTKREQDANRERDLEHVP